MSFIKNCIVNVLKKDNVISFCKFSGLSRKYSYKSAHSLDKFYPKSNLKIYTPTFVS